MLIFVYGSLKKGYSNHDLLKQSRFVGSGFTLEKFCMIDSGFPVIQHRPEQENFPVEGEVYDIGNDADTLAALDRLESEGHMYDRIAVPVYLTLKRKRVTAQVYVGTRRWAQHPHSNASYARGNNLSWPSSEDTMAESADD